ncbi:MAG: hypothetical protein A2032_01865 [Chloroflexi bacterium RBG_19FT_COMBO_49_13]|nr:MAG: hypothetical protein A2Y53_08135 [Chloroflexi bacterium RBG_16_47_49]OGO60554.1 MAG: hypothetical protein A2032_01865 [Chloroflexi bacterium RBG_19FT_COMBO_49_13]
MGRDGPGQGPAAGCGGGDGRALRDRFLWEGGCLRYTEENRPVIARLSDENFFSAIQAACQVSDVVIAIATNDVWAVGDNG